MSLFILSRLSAGSVNIYSTNKQRSSQIEPGWHAWMSYMTIDPPTADPIAQTRVRVWEAKSHRPNLTATRSAYKPYST